jgi:response regulator NasT
MSAALRIIVADDEADMRDYFQKALTRLGYKVIAVAQNGRELVQQCQALEPDLVLTDIKMPDMDGIDAAAQIHRHRPTPVVLVSAYSEPALIARAESDHIMGYLVKPIKQADLAPTLALALHRFGEFQAVRKEADDLRQALEDRKLIERAKGILMKRGRLDEPEAFRRLQKLASEQSRKLADVARMVITVEEASRPDRPQE